MSYLEKKINAIDYFNENASDIMKTCCLSNWISKKFLICYKCKHDVLLDGRFYITPNCSIHVYCHNCTQNNTINCIDCFYCQVNTKFAGPVFNEIRYTDDNYTKQGYIELFSKKDIRTEKKKTVISYEVKSSNKKEDFGCWYDVFGNVTSTFCCLERWMQCEKFNCSECNYHFVTTGRFFTTPYCTHVFCKDCITMESLFFLDCYVCNANLESKRPKFKEYNFVSKSYSEQDFLDQREIIYKRRKPPIETMMADLNINSMENHQEGKKEFY